MKAKLLILTLLITFQHNIKGQSIAISIDDVPNLSLIGWKSNNSKLLEKLDSLQIPVAIFINEGSIYKTDSVVKNFKVLNDWFKRDYITVGNHTFGHSRYSKAGLEKFTDDILKGQNVGQNLAKIHQKDFKYFRFPFNDLGKNAREHQQIDSVLKKHHYINTPFTVESSDWLYNEVYKYYLDKNDIEKAEETGENYVSLTLELFEFFDSLALKEYKRKINHIYLCHDNKLNADYLDVLVFKLKQKGYNFISLDNAMKDEIYSQKDFYDKKWGISWLYRWIEDPKRRISLMKKEPESQETYLKYKEITK